jgi:hypothetical protein
VTRTHRLNRIALTLVLASVALLAACGSDSKADSPAGGRPTTPAQLEIIEPTANQQTGANLIAQFKLTGAKFAAQTTTDVKPDEGYIHVSVDDKQVAIVDTTEVPLYALAPGPHVLQAEFVASDHAPFQNRAVASVSFTVA